MKPHKIRLILSVGAFAYFVSVLERSSMGVASLDAAERFQVGAATLSTLAVTQLAIYAAMQVPTGILLTKFGPRVLIIAGSILTGIGNLLVAIAPQFEFAVIGRMVVGLGDAFIFVSMIRLINGWIRGPRATRITQLFANIGQLGQIASAFPFAYLLGFAGWSAAFTAAASLAFIVAVLAAMLIRVEPHQTSEQAEKIGVWKTFIKNFTDPSVRKAFWVHFTLQSSGSVFILLWGYPFLIQGQGLSQLAASMLLTSFVLVGFIVGPIFSKLAAKYPDSRYQVVAGVFTAIVLSWLFIILTPGQNPLWQIILLVLVIGSGGPASMLAFDYSRTGVPLGRLSSANGLINSGGFIAAFTMMFLVGAVLDALKVLGLAQSDLYALENFKVAFSVQFLVLIPGIFLFLRERRLMIRVVSKN